MSFFSWLHFCKNVLTPSRQSRSPHRTRRQLRPQLEALEDRTVPTAVAAPGGLLSWWAGDGNAADRVGPNAGTLNNGVTFAQGQVASAFSFNTSNYVSANTTGLPIGNADRTLEMWVKVNTFGSGESYFAGYGNFGSSAQTYHLGTRSDHQLFFSQWGDVVLGPILQAGQWYHLAVTNVGNAVTLYLNGASVASGTTTINTPSGSSFDIGRVPGSLGDSRNLDGMVDEVSVYNRALSAGEIQGIYKAGSDGKVLSPISVDFPSVLEGSAGTTQPVTFTIGRTGSLSGSLTVAYATADDTATAGSDYVATSGQITFLDGEATRTVQVTVNGDNTLEPDETFKLVLTPVGQTPVMALATIVHDLAEGPLPTDWGAPVGPGTNDRTNLYTGLSWYDVTGDTGGIGSLDYATNLAANSTKDGFDDWRLPTKTEAQQAAVNGYGTQVFGGNGAHYIWWTSTAANGHNQWAVSLDDPIGHAGTVFIQGSYIYMTTVHDSGAVVDDGNPGYSTTGFTSRNTNGAYQGDQSTATAGSGSKTATWTFTGLQAGASYKVTATWKTVSGSASNAPFTIRDNGTPVATLAVNEQVAPTDFSVNDTWWKGLGTYTLTGNTLSVQLSNLANGTVLADAVRIFEVAPPPPAPLMAASPPAALTPSTALSSNAVKPLVREALHRWAVAGADSSALHGIDVRIADLPGNMLGQASGHTITLDRNAADWGWFIDPTPRDDSEFTMPGDQGEQGRMDLLTVLMHEMGHVLGREHEQAGLMAETLLPGVRELPERGPHAMRAVPGASDDQTIGDLGQRDTSLFWGDLARVLDRRREQ
jgi:hypothetical protein